MPIAEDIHCPECGVLLVRKPGGRCPECHTDVREHVLAARARETRIEKVVAIVSTLLVLTVSLFVGGCTIVEGALAWIIAGALIWWWGKGTFYEKHRPETGNDAAGGDDKTPT